MGSWIRQQGPTFAVACLALMVALGGSVYAAAKIDGRAIKRGSLPGNRLKPASVPGNRLKPASVPGNRLRRGSVPGDRLQPGTLDGGRIAPGSLTGTQVDASTLGKVPEAAHADSADSARRADTAIAATSATEAARLNGHVAACTPAQRLFAGACWELPLTPALPAPQAAAVCAARGGQLPAALALAAFGSQPGIVLAAQGEWSGDTGLISGPNSYALLTVNVSRVIDYSPANLPHPFRCVIPLIS